VFDLAEEAKWAEQVRGQLEALGGSSLQEARTGVRKQAELERAAARASALFAAQLAAQEARLSEQTQRWAAQEKAQAEAAQSARLRAQQRAASPGLEAHRRAPLTREDLP